MAWRKEGILCCRLPAQTTKVDTAPKDGMNQGVLKMVVTSILPKTKTWNADPWRLKWVAPEPSLILPPIARSRALWIGQTHWLLLVAAMILGAFLVLGALAAYRIELMLPEISDHFQSALGVFFWSAVGWWVIGTYFYWGWQLRCESRLTKTARTQPRF